MQANIFKIKRNELADGSGCGLRFILKDAPCAVSGVQHRRRMSARPGFSGTASTVSTAISVSANVPPEVWHFQTTVSPLPRTPVHSACLYGSLSVPNASHFVGQMMDMDEIMEKILADRELYGNGGVILSGGDPLMQPEAATAVLKKCKEHGIRTAIETTAFAKPWLSPASSPTRT